jgi:hypothetical protein
MILTLLDPEFRDIMVLKNACVQELELFPFLNLSVGASPGIETQALTIRPVCPSRSSTAILAVYNPEQGSEISSGRSESVRVVGGCSGWFMIRSNLSGDCGGTVTLVFWVGQIEQRMKN